MEEKYVIDLLDDFGANEFISDMQTTKIPSDSFKMNNKVNKVFELLKDPRIMSLISNPKKIGLILKSIALLSIVGLVSLVYYTIAYYYILIPLYIASFCVYYIYSKRNHIGFMITSIPNKIKKIFTKKNK